MFKNVRKVLKKYLPSKLKLIISNILGSFNEREYYDDSHEFPDGSTISSHIKIAEIFINKLKAGNRVLDLGCGSGYLANRSAKLGCEVVGVDYSEKALKYASHRNSGPDNNRVKYLKLDLQGGLPFENYAFDVVIIEEVLEHLKNPREVLLDAFRVVNKGGRLLVSVPYDAEPSAYHISPMNEKTIPVIFEGLNFKLSRPFLPWGTTHIIEIEK